MTMDAPSPDLHDKLGDDMRHESDDTDHGIAPETTLTDADIDEMSVRDMASRDRLNKPVFLTFADACSILGHPLPRPDIAEARQTAGVRCKDLR